MSKRTIESYTSRVAEMTCVGRGASAPESKLDRITTCAIGATTGCPCVASSPWPVSQGRRGVR
jgi:hypothetical protein